ncbi:MAG: hypothetical protein C6I01_03510 [Epsilonproteobacteria bacterium]|nr:hypothetical protein [Campylobacterota bacterium]NPA89763.1 hypothetical protein [Campylobacterota bacterium]
MERKLEKLQNSLPPVEVVVVALGRPLLVGVYQNRRLIHQWEEEGLTSELLPKIFKEILKKYSLQALYYARGPGSYMGVKLSYLYLKTLQIVFQIPFKGVDGFYFTGGAPIKGPGKSVFVKKEGIIFLTRGEAYGEFKLPVQLEPEIFSQETEPLYILNPV